MRMVREGGIEPKAAAHLPLVNNQPLLPMSYSRFNAVAETVVSAKGGLEPSICPSRGSPCRRDTKRHSPPTVAHPIHSVNNFFIRQVVPSQRNDRLVDHRDRVGNGKAKAARHQ